VSLVNTKLNKFLSLFASCFLLAYGTAVRAEVNIDSMSPSSRASQTKDVDQARNVDQTRSVDPSSLDAISSNESATDSLTTDALTDVIALDDAYTRLQALLNDKASSDIDSSELSAGKRRPLLDSENDSLNNEEPSHLEALSPNLSFSSLDFSNSTLDTSSFSNSTLLADGGDPNFEDAIFWSPSRPDSHAPIGVMGDHTHEQGEFMLSYRYMYMDMDGNRSGTESLSTAEVLQDFMVTPVRMTMEMHMLGAMYAPTDDLTLMAMLPYVTKKMDHLTRTGVEFTTHSEGIGDVGLGGLYTIFDANRQRVHLNLGFSIPTGSIEERDTTPAGPNQILPYPMQIGSGTFDLRPGITYLGQAGRWSWGSQASGIIRLGENSNGYRQGHQFALTGWSARSWNNWFSTSLRLNGRTFGDYGGQDDRLNPAMIPTADPDRRAGTQIDVGLGLNFYVPEGGAQGLRLATEFNLPIFRSLSGPQLETDFSATAGVQYAF